MCAQCLAYDDDERQNDALDRAKLALSNPDRAPEWRGIVKVAPQKRQTGAVEQ